MSFNHTDFKIEETNRWFQLVPYGHRVCQRDNLALDHPGVDFNKVLSFAVGDCYYEGTLDIYRAFVTHLYEPYYDEAFEVLVFKAKDGTFWITSEQNEDLEEAQATKNFIQDHFEPREVSRWYEVVLLRNHVITTNLPVNIPRDKVVTYSWGPERRVLDNYNLPVHKVLTVYVFENGTSKFYKTNAIQTENGRMWVRDMPHSSYAQVVTVIDVV